MLINGAPGSLISIRDRGLLYGDGVFRTFRSSGGKPLHWPLHYAKLLHDCAALGLSCPDLDLLTAELQSLLADHADAVFKIIVTRGLADRGYAPSIRAASTHIWDVFPAPAYPDHPASLCVCSLRLGNQPRLAGIKHLNRLENVLAARECADFDEGLLLDADGFVIEGVRSNLFLIMNDALVTPDLSRCGVAGVQRERVMAHAASVGMKIEVRNVKLSELQQAQGLFLTSSVFGLWPVARLGDTRWSDYARAEKISDHLSNQAAMNA